MRVAVLQMRTYSGTARHATVVDGTRYTKSCRTTGAQHMLIMAFAVILQRAVSAMHKHSHQSALYCYRKDATMLVLGID
eukprot:21466-Heterococcus_DN1.PRE.2